MFALLTSARSALRQFHAEVDVDGLAPVEAKALVEEAAAVEMAAAGVRLRALRLLEDEPATVDWLAKETGQSKFDARRDIETASRVRSATDAALKEGRLSADQASEVTSGTSADPGAEEELLDSARSESIAELRRRAKRVRAAATDDAEKEKQAQAERTVCSDSDVETGKGRIRVSGPAAKVAQMLAFLEPFAQAEFDRARMEGRRERRGALLFDALLKALSVASGNTDGDDRAGPPAKILARVDATALLRGRTEAGETCEIDGLGPVPVASLRELLPDAAIYLILTNGVDAFNVTNLARRTTAHQQVVLQWLGVECARQGCGATRHLQIDHRLDWAHTHVTQLRALDWLCVPDHRRKTHGGWSLVEGRGRRPMVPPDHPDHPANAPPQANAA